MTVTITYVTLKAHCDSGFMPNQRSKKRNAIIGVYVEHEVKAEIERRAKQNGMTLADYVRNLLKDTSDPKRRMNK